jgi:hypothetical protein
MNRNTKSLISFHPKYTPDVTGKDELYADLIRAALVGGDHILSVGKGNSKDQCLYLRCQCSIIYRGSKVNKISGDIVERPDYQNKTYCNDCKNQRHGQKGMNGSHKTGIDRHLSRDHARCPFGFSLFKDAKGYFIKSHLGSVSHKFHHCCDHLRTSTSLLDAAEAAIVLDLDRARAKLCTAVNLHYVRSARQGTPTIFTSSQLHCLVKKNSPSAKGADDDDHKENGKIDDIFQFLETTGNHYISLLARGPTCGQDISTDPSGKATLYNETRIGPFSKQDDVEVACHEEEEMLRIVDNH